MNAFMGAYEYVKDGGGDSAKIVFDGAGTQAAAAFAAKDHEYNELFEKVRGLVEGACSYCAGAYKMTEKIEAANIPLIDEFKGHPSFKKLIDDGYQVLVF
ncbi:MAG: DsrE family protein [Chthoniobacterales bacterium]|nr:DsrE family protein [Chthoniobacterales bacterium]